MYEDSQVKKIKWAIVPQTGDGFQMKWIATFRLKSTKGHEKKGQAEVTGWEFNSA